MTGELSSQLEPITNAPISLLKSSRKLTKAVSFSEALFQPKAHRTLSTQSVQNFATNDVSLNCM